MTHVYDQDAMGNVSGLWDATSGTPALVQNLKYEPWGLLEAGSQFGTLGDTSRVLWKGLAWETGNTKLYFMRNRWFGPEAKRFVSEDPIGEEGGLNVYVFASCDPINSQDPFGLEPGHYEGDQWCWGWSDCSASELNRPGIAGGSEL